MNTLFALLLLASPPPDIEAIGVVLSDGSGTPVAVLRSAGRSRTVAVGERAFDVEVVAVSAQAVTVESDGERREIRLATAPVRPANPSQQARLATRDAALPTPPEAEATEPAIRTMDRGDIQRRLALEVPRILAETVAVPVTEDGNVVGLALTRIAEGTLLGETGLRPGDVLTKLNDTPVDGLPTLLGLWPRFQTESQIRAEVLRNGQPLTLTLNIR